MNYKELQRLRKLQKEYGLPFVPKDIWEEAVLYSGNHYDDDDTLVFWIRYLMDLDEEYIDTQNLTGLRDRSRT